MADPVISPSTLTDEELLRAAEAAELHDALNGTAWHAYEKELLKRFREMVEHKLYGVAP